MPLPESEFDPAAARAEIARATRTHRRTRDPEDAARVDQLRSEYRTCLVVDYVRKIVDQFPPLSSEQRDRIAAVLYGSGRKPTGGEAA